MSDLKSKLPDLKELASMTGKFMQGVKGTVEEIIEDYKKKRETTTEETTVETKKETKTKPKAKKSEK